MSYSANSKKALESGSSPLKSTFSFAKSDFSRKLEGSYEIRARETYVGFGVRVGLIPVEPVIHLLFGELLDLFGNILAHLETRRILTLLESTSTSLIFKK